jgi:putative copper export protein
MTALYVLSVWLHILAATVWIGGMLFLVLVVVPWLRKQDRAVAAKLMRETGTRFRTVGWWAFAVLIVTGSFNLYCRGVRLGDLTDATWLTSPFGRAVAMKLALFVLVLAMSVVHDFVLGPRSTRVAEKDPRSPEALALRAAASWMGRVNVLLAFAIVALAVIIVRGWP